MPVHALVVTAGGAEAAAQKDETGGDRPGRPYGLLRTDEKTLHGGDLAGPNHSRDSHEAGFSAPPCFFHRDCGGTAAIEKQGKAVCRACAGGLNGLEYPLRAPSREPLYRKAEELVLQLEMKEGRRKRSGE
jgi:hypothetical protein